MTFTVNEDLLGETIRLSEEQITLRVPKNWNKASDTIIGSLREKMASAQNTQSIDSSNSQSNIRLQIETLYLLNKQNASLTVSTVTFPNTDSTDELRRKHYYWLMKSRIDTTNLGFAEYSSNGIKFAQYMIRNAENVSFKLLFSGKKDMIQCDYIIPTSIFQQEIRAVESSIGSIIFN